MSNYEFEFVVETLDDLLDYAEQSDSIKAMAETFVRRMHEQGYRLTRTEDEKDPVAPFD